jgi:molybdate/tungstate transport system substrate-binding protein
VKVTGKQPGKFMEMKGASVTYGVTMIKDAPNREAPTAFLKYMLDPQGGLKVLKDQGQPPFVPCRVPTDKMKALISGDLQGLVEVKN